MIELGTVTENIPLNRNIFKLTLELPKISRLSKPGQFCQLKVNDNLIPLLRRPFSIHDVEGNFLSFLIEIKSTGTKILSRKKVGDVIDVLGPLGKGFNIEGNFDMAVIVAGGIGVAPFRFLTKQLEGWKKVKTLLGVRNVGQLVSEGLKNVLPASDDGSIGFDGNVVQLLEREVRKGNNDKVKIFACGPTPMFKALKRVTEKYGLDCEVSVESNMACGTGLCQGCAVKSAKSEEYFLVCKDGPVFNINDLEF